MNLTAIKHRGQPKVANADGTVTHSLVATKYSPSIQFELIAYDLTHYPRTHLISMEPPKILETPAPLTTPYYS